MALLDNQLLALATIVADAIPGISGIIGALPVGGITTSLPHSQLFGTGTTRDPAIPWRISKNHEAITWIVTDDGLLDSDMRNYGISFRNELQSNPNLNSTVNWVTVGDEALILLAAPSTGRKQLVLTIDTEVWIS